MSNNALLVAKLALSLQESIINKEFEGKSPVKIIAKGMELLNEVPQLMGTTKKHILIQVIERIASGKDGIAGTDDDLLSKEYIDVLRSILEHHIIEGIIDVVADAANGKFHIGKAAHLAENVATSVYPKCFDVFFKPKGA
jgi:hypothetical protein